MAGCTHRTASPTVISIVGRVHTGAIAEGGFGRGTGLGAGPPFADLTRTTHGVAAATMVATCIDVYTRPAAVGETRVAGGCASTHGADFAFCAYVVAGAAVHDRALEIMAGIAARALTVRTVHFTDAVDTARPRCAGCPAHPAVHIGAVEPIANAFFASDLAFRTIAPVAPNGGIIAAHE